MNRHVNAISGRLSLRKPQRDSLEKHGGKTWRYALIPHDRISENMSIEGLVT